MRLHNQKVLGLNSPLGILMFSPFHILFYVTIKLKIYMYQTPWSEVNEKESKEHHKHCSLHFTINERFSVMTEFPIFNCMSMWVHVHVKARSKALTQPIKICKTEKKETWNSCSFLYVCMLIFHFQCAKTRPLLTKHKTILIYSRVMYSQEGPSSS